MEIGQVQFIIAWVSTIVTILGTILAAFGFLHRDMRRGFDRVDQKFHRVDEKFDRVDEKFNRVDEKLERLGERLSNVDVRMARIEGHLGIGVPVPADETPAPNPSRAVTSSDPAVRPDVEFA